MSLDGASDAVARIWAQYENKLKAFIRSKGLPSDQAEDVLQEVMLKSLNYLQTHPEPEQLQAWLFKVAQNALVDSVRHQNRQTQLAEEASVLMQLTEADEQDLTACLEPFLAEISDEQAELIRQLDLNKGSQKGRADALGVPYTTLKSRLQAARGELGKVFKACCQSAPPASGRCC